MFDQFTEINLILFHAGFRRFVVLLTFQSGFIIGELLDVMLKG